MPSGGLRQDIEQTYRIFVGEDRSLAWNVTQSDDTTPQPMTGWTLTFEVLDKRGGTVALTKSVTVQNGNGTDDQALVSLADTDTEPATGLGDGKFYYQVRRTDAGQEGTIAFGDLIVLPQTVT